MWATVEAITTCMNLMVIACVLNQSTDHWLLLDVLMTIINLIMAMESQLDPLVDGSETCDQFDVELQMLSKNMRQEVVKVMKPFLQFLRAFDSFQVHNMLALMLDPHYKSLRVSENYVGHGNAIHLTLEYDMKEVIPFLITKFERLNHFIQALMVGLVDGFPIEEEEINTFGVGVLMEEFSRALVTRELSLFQRLVIPP